MQGFLICTIRASTDKQRHFGLDALGFTDSVSYEWLLYLGFREAALAMHGRDFSTQFR